jgi:predicted anti-sigma-YlaC factor YlaD
MNCLECKELLVGYVEGLLDESQSRMVEEHLKSCPACRAEAEEVNSVHDRLVANGKVVGRTGLENVVMNRIVREQNMRLKTVNKVSNTIRIGRLLMKNPIIKLAVAAVIVVAVLIGLHFVVNPFGATITFAKVIQPILNARTVVFDFVVGGEETGSVMHDIVVGSKIRRTFSNMDPIMIIDLDSAKMLTLDPKTKGAAYIDIQGPLQEGTKNLLEFVRKVITSLKDLPVQELGQRDIDGRKAIGFYAAEKPNIELTIWADPVTANPIRIEMLLGQSLYILKNFEFDVPVDESLVSMKPPAGYTLSDKQFDMTQFAEQDFITVLRLWVEHLLGGNFPQNLSAGELMSLAPRLAEKIGQLNVSEEEKTQLGMTMGKGLVFFQQLDPTGVTWHYAGNGVKLGEADKAIFWYQPKGSQTYRVIHGDLSVKDVSPENLPK